MAYKPMAGKDGKPTDADAEQDIVRKVRLTLTSSNVPTLEKVCEELVQSAKMNDLKVKGPVRMPTKTMRITCRKTPCGEGSKTWDRFQMRVHKRNIMIETTSSILKKVTSIALEPGVDIEVTKTAN